MQLYKSFICFSHTKWIKAGTIVISIPPSPFDTDTANHLEEQNKAIWTTKPAALSEYDSAADRARTEAAGMPVFPHYLKTEATEK